MSVLNGRRRLGVLVLGLVVSVSACTGGSDRSAPPPTSSTSEVERSTTTRAGQVVVSTSTVPPAAAVVDPGAARAAVEKVRGELPYPADVLDCLAVEASADPEVFEGLGSPGEGEGWVMVQEAAAACVVEVRSGPRFAEDLQRASGGKLSDEQVACAARKYGELTPEQIEAAAGAVMNPEQAEPSATAPIEEIYETCGIARAGR